MQLLSVEKIMLVAEICSILLQFFSLVDDRHITGKEELKSI